MLGIWVPEGFGPKFWDGNCGGMFWDLGGWGATKSLTPDLGGAGFGGPDSPSINDEDAWPPE